MSQSRPKGFEITRFAGITLGGGKGRKTCLALVDFFTSEKKVFLSELYYGIEEGGRVSGDTQLVRKLERHKNNLKMVAIDAPLQLPKCIRCRLVCPGHEKCTEPQIRWMWARHKKRGKLKRPNKIFTPYTERCVEQYVASETDCQFIPDHALGANRAPLAARAMYLRRRLGQQLVVEVLPKLSIWNLGKQIGFNPNQLLNYRQVTRGQDIRQAFLDKWSEKDMSFIYHRDLKTMAKDAFAFEAFICAYTAFLKYRGLCEPIPKDFPVGEAWVAFPKIEN